MAQVLIIDDDRDMSFTLCGMIQHMQHSADTAYTLSEGLTMAESGAYDVLFLDVRLPDGNGLSVIPRLQQMSFAPEIVIVTAYGDTGGAELALKGGVWDYLTKPLSMEGLKLSLDRALKYREQKKRCATKVAINRCGIVGDSPQIIRCLDKLAHAASIDAGILITGETGTGKEIFCRAIHANSSRANANLVTVDCAALPEQLVESILFGHVKGAFTGADEAQAGLIKEADGGTLFLDEIGELPVRLQKAFLRVLQERRFRPVGMRHEIASNFRVIAATNRNLDVMADKCLFRKDLLFRVRTLVIDLPPLRERAEDIKPLALHHMDRICDRYGIEPKGFSSEFLESLQAYSWPGNVRELVGVLETSITAARHEAKLFARHLPLDMRIRMKSQALGPSEAHSGSKRTAESLGKRLPEMQEFIDNAKRDYLLMLMQQTDGDVKQASTVSGLPKTTLYDHLKKYKIPRTKPNR